MADLSPELVESITVDFYRRVLDDERLAGFFAGKDTEQIIRAQVEFQMSDDLRGYGPAIEAVHQPLRITHGDMDRMVQLFLQSLVAHGVGRDTAIRLTAKMGHFRSAVVHDA